MNGESHIGQYKIVRTLGAGGMGTVYLGEHLLLGRLAAIKTLLPSLSSHHEIVERFFTEARAISSISDPGVVQIFDFGYHVDGTAYIVMEFLEGENLAARLDRLGKLPLPDALRMARQMASSLAAAHDAGIIHRDLKPGNVFVIRDSEAQGGERTKILDFGVCKLLTPGDTTMTQTGTMLGTPVYMSPEQCRGSGQVDPRSDVYSVGCALFHMLTGHTPFECESVGDFIAAHLKDPPRAPSALEPTLPPAVDALVLRCLEKRPEDRYQSMRELQVAVEDVLATLSDPGRVPTPPPLHETPLATGFKSAYDVNHGGPRTVDGKLKRPSHAWFVDSLAPSSASSIEDGEHAWQAPEDGMSLAQRAGLVLVLFLGILGGLVVASDALSDDTEAPALAGPLVPTTEEPAQPATRVVHETMPIESIAHAEDADELEPEPEPERPGSEATEAPKPERPRPARTQTRPRPRRPARSEPVTQPDPQPEDDLYDTR